MKMTAFGDYGLRVMLLLAGSERPIWSSAAMAERLQVSREHLVKVVQRLAAAGYVRTTRGVGGGVALNSDPTTVRLGDLLRWMEEDQALVECMREDGGGCVLTPLCQLRGRIGGALNAFYDQLNQGTVADCVNRPLRGFLAGPV